MKLARKLTEEGAATFSKADAKAMVAYYTENAIVFAQGKNDEGHTVKEYDGKAEIERAYADFFKGQNGTIQAKNTVEYARLLALGVAIGLGASLASVKLLSGLVQNVSTFDPYSFAAVAVLLFAAGIFASFWPARRAARVDPITALRDE